MNCLICGVPLNYTQVKYCSRACWRKAINSKGPTYCPICKKNILQKGEKYCSPTCYTTAHPKTLKIKSYYYNPDIKDSKTACKIVQCDATVALFKKLPCYSLLENVADPIIKKIRELNKELFKKGIFTSKNIILATAIYLTLSITQEQTITLVDCSTISIRNLIKRLDLNPDFGNRISIYLFYKDKQ